MDDNRPFTPEDLPPIASASNPEAADATATHGNIFSQLPVSFKYGGSFPDALKIKKKLNIGPLQLSVAGIWERQTKEFYQKVSLKDRFFKGKFNFRVDDPTVEYRKRFSVSPRGVPGCVVATASWRVYDYKWMPAIRVGFELGDGSHVLQANEIASRKKLYFSQTLGLEALSVLHINLPNTMEWTGHTSEGSVPFRQEGFHVDLDVKQLNLVLRL